MNINLTTTGLLKPGSLPPFMAAKQSLARKAVRDGFRAAAPEIVTAVRNNVQQALKIKRMALLKSYVARHFDSKPDRMPAMMIGSTQRIAAIHEFSGTITPKGKLLLIPIGGLRVGAKAFKRYVAQLIASGNAFFKKQPNGNLILFAENIKENDTALRRFKRNDRALKGKKSHKRGAEIPIAVAVKSVRLQRRTRVQETIAAKLPVVARAINDAFQRLR